MRTVPREVAGLGRTPGWDVFSAYASNHGDLFGPNTFGHTGYTGTSILIDPDNDTAVILLINAVHPGRRTQCSPPPFAGCQCSSRFYLPARTSIYGSLLQTFPGI